MLSFKKHKIVLLLVLVSFCTLVFASPVHAIIGTGIFDWSTAVLDAMDFIDQAVLAFLVKVLFFAFGSAGFVFIAANLLEWAYQLPVNVYNDLVLSGWNFVSGLVNLFFILAFIFIALAYILKVETFQLKKALPRLIIVILLVNFSLLVVGMFVDAAQFFMNTFLTAFGGDFVTMALLPLRQSFGALLNVILITITGYVASAFTVFGSVFSLAIILSQFFAGELLANVISLIVMIALNFIMGAIFFMYAVLFIVRIAALWLLAIFAPIAFFAFIFDQTKKWGEKWFKTVFQWAFLGVVAFFLLSLIVNLFTTAFVQRPGMMEVSPIPGLPAIRLPDNIYSYIFLVIFLYIAFHASMKYVPEGAQHVVGFVKGQWAAMGGVAGVTKLARRGVEGAGRRVVGEKTRKRLREWSTVSTRDEKGKLVSGKRLASPYLKRRLGKAGLSVTEEADKRVYDQSHRKALSQDAATNLNEFRQTHDPAKQAALMSAMVEKKQMKEAMDKKIFGDSALKADNEADAKAIKSAYMKSVYLGKKDDQEAIERTFVRNLGEEFGNLKKEAGYYDEDDIKKDREKGYMSYSDKIIGEAKSADKIKQLQKGWWEKEDLMDATHKFWSGHQISEAARSFGRGFTDEFQNAAKDIDWYFNVNSETGNIRNPNVPRYLSSTGAASLGMAPLEGGIDKKDINEKWGEARRQSKNLKEELGRLKSMAEVTETEKKSPPPPRGRRGIGRKKSTDEEGPPPPPRGRRGVS